MARYDWPATARRDDDQPGRARHVRALRPTVDPTTICIGDHWTAGERLADLVVRIGEMLAFQAYNIKSPLDAEAAMWADLHQGELPIDSRPLRPPGME